MCRVAFLKGIDFLIAQELATLQSCGASRPPSFWRSEDVVLVHSRFDVTSEGFPDNEYPLFDGRYAVHFNGEVFGFGDQRYVDTTEPTDVHYSLSLIRAHGLMAFLQNADLQGTFQLHDSQLGQTWIFVDQINSGGGFYASWEDKMIAAQEVALVHRLLSVMGVSDDVVIRTIPNGCALRVERSGAHQIIELRPQARLVYSSPVLSLQELRSVILDLKRTLEEAVVRRIPQTGPVVVLASGGIDSSVILAIVKEHLARTGALHRLKVVIFGKEEVSPDEVNDLQFCLHLLDELGLPRAEHLIVVHEDLVTRERLLLDKVFCDQPRLIPPNPILGSQIRHTVRMSLTLAEVVRRCPETKVVLTGDVADELFAGYPSMRRGVTSRDTFVERIREKLADLPLNDAARYTLASLHGCRTVLGYTRKPAAPGACLASSEAASPRLLEPTAEDHPLEVRTPFSSHHVLDVLREASADLLIGRIGGILSSKFLLRAVGVCLGLPMAITVRRKIPFNHGGTGLSNDSRDSSEMKAAKQWNPFTDEQLCQMMSEEKSKLLQLGLIGEAAEETDILEKRFEQVVAYFAAQRAGLNRLIKGGAFREKMPDTVYATDLKDDLYTPADLISLDLEQDETNLSKMRGLMFTATEISNDVLLESNDGVGTYTVRGVTQRRLYLHTGIAHFGLIARGKVTVTDSFGKVQLSKGMYFCINDGQIDAGSREAAVLVISTPTSGLRQFGGPVEDAGRLRYVSGCSDTLLVSPPRRGDSCLNHLHIPAQVIQTTHYHPSDRVGIILRGLGICRADGRAYELYPGLAWRIPAGLDHHFESGSEGLDVITWHPDSDFGPTDEDHPMINRTWQR